MSTIKEREIGTDRLNLPTKETPEFETGAEIIGKFSELNLKKDYSRDYLNVALPKMG